MHSRAHLTGGHFFNFSFSWLALALAAPQVLAASGPCLLQSRTNRSKAAKLNFTPFRLDRLIPDGLDMPDGPHEGKLVEVSQPSTESPMTTPSGILCQTLLHPSVHDRHYMRFAVAGLGPDFANKFDSELKHKCEQSFTADAWSKLWDDYSGNWSHDRVTASDNALWGAMGQWLNEERKLAQSKVKTWDQFRNPDQHEEKQSEYVGLLQHVANATQPTIALNRIMDFGCGDGVELSNIARGLGLGKKDTFCLDVVDYVADAALSKVTKLMVPVDSADSYESGLQGHLDGKSLRGTVSAIFSQVTFHHITQPAMRVSALKFIHESLAEGGFFMMAEWDNIATPIDYTIYFDLAHYLPTLFFQDPAPEVAQLGPLDTKYLSVQAWAAMMASNGLPYDAARSRLPWTAQNGSTVWLTPEATAEGSSGRNFLAVYSQDGAMENSLRQIRKVIPGVS